MRMGLLDVDTVSFPSVDDGTGGTRRCRYACERRLPSGTVGAWHVWRGCSRSWCAGLVALARHARSSHSRHPYCCSFFFCSVHSPPITQLLVPSDAPRILHALCALSRFRDRKSGS